MSLISELVGGLSEMTQISSFDWIIEKTSAGYCRVQDSHGNIKKSMITIADAVEWTNEQGGTTKLKRATYETDRAIRIFDGYYALVGEGIGVTIIKLKDGANDNIIRVEGDAPYLLLKDFELDGNKSNQDYGTDRDDRSGIFVPNSSSVDFLRIESVKVHDVLSGAGIRIINADNPRLINVISTDNGISGGTFPSDGIFLAQTKDAQVIGVTSKNNTDTGLANDLNEGLTILGGLFENNSAQGVSAVNQSEDITSRGIYSINTKIIGATIRGNGYGVYVDKFDSSLPNVDRVHIIGSEITNNNSDQIHCANVAKVVVAKSAVGYNTSGIGVNLLSGVVQVNIIGNFITDLDTGVEINGADAIRISDNIVSAVTTFVNKVTTPGSYMEVDNLSV